MRLSPSLYLISLLFTALASFSAPGQQPELVVQTGHTGSANAVAYSPDGKLLASGGDDRTVKILDSRSGRELRTLGGMSARVQALVFSPDSKILAIGSGDVKLWDVVSGKELRTLKVDLNYIPSLAFSPDGKTLAGSDYINLTVKIWDVASGAELRTLKGHSNAVNSVAFSPDGKILASGSSDHTVKLWDVASGTELRTLKGDSGDVRYVLFCPDGKTLASGGIDVKLWNIESGAELRALKRYRSEVGPIALSPDGKLLASGGGKTVKLWDVATGAESRVLEGESSHLNPFFITSIAFSRDGKTIASGSSDHAVRLWDVEAGRLARELRGHSDSVTSTTFSADGKILLRAGHGRLKSSLRMWNVESGKEMPAPKESYRFIKFALSPDSKTLVMAGNDLELWDVASGRQLRVLKEPSYVYWVAFSHDGKMLATVSNGRDKMLASRRDDDTYIKLWDVEQGIELRTIKGAPRDADPVIEFSPDGLLLACAGDSGSIELWDVASGTQLRTLNKHNGEVRSIRFSPDGRIVASASADQTIKLWNVAEGTETRTLKGHLGFVTSVAFSPDGKLLASASQDNTVRLWNAATGTELRKLAGHSSSVNSVSFSRDGRLVASGGLDATIKLWSVNNGELVANLVALDEEDWVVTTPEGRFDTNKNLDYIEGLSWVMPDDPSTAMPLEIFMRDYYEPQLLSRLLKCNQLQNCNREFKPIRDISKLNRLQPMVKIHSVSPPDDDGYVNVTVEVGKGEDVYAAAGKQGKSSTGVYDLRLFRDGQMVGSWPYDSAEKLLQQATEDLKSTGKLTLQQRQLKELRAWQQATEIKPAPQAKLDKTAETLTPPAFRVRLPRGKDASQVEFSAYAFNEDRIKSRTALWQWPEDLKLKLPKALPVKSRAYIITVGVNAYENSDFNLEFAADDATRMLHTLTDRLTKARQYQEVIPISLLSDYKVENGRKVTTLKQATKDNFRTVLQLLSGQSSVVDKSLLTEIVNAEKLREATPEDLVLILFSSHGYADRNGNFYFIPYDTGAGKGKVFTEGVRRRSISSDELSLWLRGVDAGEMVMIVDACHSAAAVAGQEFKPGPMGSRGLGQLSYDKGMRILTATQSDNVALENGALKQGLLTYALVRDGIEAGQADYRPKDKVINMSEWLSYGVERVPELYEEVSAGKIQTFGLGAGEQTKVVMTMPNGPRNSMSKALEEVAVNARAQQPSLFDFTRKRRDIVLATGQ